MRRLVVLVLLCTVAGCGGGSNDSVETFDGVTVRMGKSQPIDTISREGSVLTFKSGNTTYSVDHKKLTANGREYGTLKDGDDVLIDGATVNINGSLASPTPPK